MHGWAPLPARPKKFSRFRTDSPPLKKNSLPARCSELAAIAMNAAQIGAKN